MKLVVFNDKHKLDIDHEIFYLSSQDIQERGVGQVAEEIKWFAPDLIIEEEKNDGVSRFADLYKMFPKVTKAWWMIDAHCNLIEHVVYAKQFDYIFCAQSWFIPLFKHETKGRLFYLPLCHTQTATELAASPAADRRDLGFSFIGSIRPIHVERRQLVREFLQKYGDYFFARKADHGKTLEYLRRSRLSFNCSLNNDLNFRVWEALACGAILLTDDVTDLDSIQGLREHLATYDKMHPDWNHLITGSKYNEGQQFAKDHTYTHRYNQLIEMVGSGTQYEYR